MEYYKDTHVSIVHNSDINGINIHCKGFASSEQYRKGLHKLLEIIKHHELSKILVDTRHMKMIGADDQKWTIKFFLPKAYKIGCRAVAIIPGEDYFNRMTVNLILENVVSPCNIKYTSDLESAADWLKTI